MSDDKKAAAEVDNRPTSQRDLEARLKNGFMPDRVDNTKDDVANPEKVVTPYAVKGNDTSGYIGVSPEYMTYANDTDKPLTATEGPEAEALKLLQSGVANVRKFQAPDNTPATEVGTAGVETIYTGTSGEDYSPKLVDGKPDHFGPAVVMPEEKGAAPVATSTSAPTPSKSTPAKPARS